MEIPERIKIEGEKNREIKHTLNDILDYLTWLKDRSPIIEPAKEENLNRMTVQTSTHVPLEHEEAAEPEVGTIEQLSEKMWRIKEEHGWKLLTQEEKEAWETK